MNTGDEKVQMLATKFRSIRGIFATRRCHNNRETLGAQGA